MKVFEILDNVGMTYYVVSESLSDAITKWNKLNLPLTFSSPPTIASVKVLYGRVVL